MKGKLSALASNNPYSQEARAARRFKLGRGSPSLGALLETFQTTDQLYGVGLSFGGIVGAISEGAYAAELNSRGQPVTVLPPSSALGTAGVVTGVVALRHDQKPSAHSPPARFWPTSSAAPRPRHSAAKSKPPSNSRPPHDQRHVRPSRSTSTSSSS
jgi:hypothetical protein